ncbi:MAG: PAS domain S-box protein [Bacteroidia bacterium]
MHKLLKRQLEKYFGSALPDHQGFDAFIKAVNEVYHEDEKRLKNLENIIEVSSDEAKAEVDNIRFAIEEASLVAVIGRNGRISSVNKNLQKLTGLQAEDFINKTALEIAGPEQEELITRAIRRATAGNIWQGEIFVKTRKGNLIWLNGTVTPLKDAHGIITRYLAILHDTTARKLFENEIITSEKKYRSVINSVHDIIFQADKNLEFTFLNSAWKEITGFNIEDGLGSRLVDYIYAEDLSIFNRLLNSIQSFDINSGSTVLRLKPKTGQYRWVDFNLKPNYQPGGAINSFSGTIRDVTESRRNEELLARSNAFQRALLNSARQAIIATDESGIIKTFNKGAEKMTGHLAEDVIGLTSVDKLLIFDAPFTNHINLGELLSSLNQQRNGEIECHLKTTYSKSLIVSLSMSEIADDKANGTGYLFIFSDISSRKEAETEVRKLSTILEESPDYVSYYDMTGEMIYANKAFKEIRYDQQNECKYELYPAWAELIIRRKAIPYAMENGAWKGETAILDKDGNEIPVHQLIIIHRNEEGTAIFRSSVMRDITQRKKYEYKLLQSEKRNRDLVNYSQAIIATHDLGGKILSINPAGCNLLEYDLEEMVGKNIMDFMPASHRELFQTEYLGLFKKSKTAEGILYLLSKSGQQLSLLYKNYKVDEAGEESYIIGFAQDITQRLLAEAELKTAKLSAEESARAKELFLANMSHEIRTPMNGIVGLTNLLLKSPLNDKQKEYASSVKQSAENLLVIINAILDFSKIQAGKFEITKKPFDLANLFYNLRQTFRVEAQRKGIELQTSIDDNIHQILNGDEIRLNQIISNLVSNALKFTENGKISLAARLLNQTNEACRLRFSVTDTGIGIAPEKLDKIFNSFTQANSDTSRKYGGTGLGLTIVKNMLELMGGRIHVKSEPGSGSTFFFDLNLEKAHRLIEDQQVHEEDYSGKLKGLRILMAEDNKVNQLFASELIQDWGASLDIADNGKLAVEMARKNEYDLILMDIQMPEMSGLDATHYIRNEFKGPKKDIVIIAMTANAMKGNEEQYGKAGMNDVIFKPYESAELFTKIKRFTKVKDSGSAKEKKHTTPVAEHLDSVPTPVNDLSLKHASMHVLTAFSRGKDSFIVKMLTVLIESVPPTSIELNDSIRHGNWEKVVKAAHKLIPNMNMMGNPGLEKSMKWIEDQANVEASRKAVSELWPSVAQELELAVKDLHTALKFYQARETSAK